MLIRHATLPDGRTDIDLLVQDGRIAAVGPHLPAPAGVEIVDAQGFLLSPPFVDAHFHMDATLRISCITAACPPHATHPRTSR